MFTVKSALNYLQSAGVRHQAGELIRPLAQQLQILTSPRAWQAVGPALTDSLETAGIRWQLSYLDGECTAEAIEAFRIQVVASGADGILAAGGGRVLDTAKAVNNALGDRQLIAVPTQAATCAAWSPLAIVYNQAGGHLSSNELNTMPALILADSEVIARSEPRYLRSGIIDALAKWYEFEPYQRQNPGLLALDLRVSVARQATEVFLQLGEEAVQANRQQQVTPALEKVIEANIVLAGLSNSIRGSLPTPGVAHVIHDTLTHQPELHHWLHGEKVGFSLLIQSLLSNGNQAPDADLLTVLQRFGSPLRLPELQGDRSERLRRISHDIRFPAASLSHLPFEITADRLYQALLRTETTDYRR